MNLFFLLCISYLIQSQFCNRRMNYSNEKANSGFVGDLQAYFLIAMIYCGTQYVP